jgi:uncharacterized membrane protein YfhO
MVKIASSPHACKLLSHSIIQPYHAIIGSELNSPNALKDHTFMNIKNIRHNPLFIYSLFFSILIVLIFAPYALMGSSLIWNADGITQHYPALMQWHHDLHNLIFRHELPAMWNWHIGLGQDYLQTFSYYVMGDIFTYPIAFIKTAHVLDYYNVMLIVRLWLAGLSFVFVAPRLLKTNISAWILSLGAISYVMTGYTSFAAFEHPFFINPLIIFPLLIWSLFRLMRSGKWGIFTLFVFWTLWNNFYFAFMLALATGLVWVTSIILKPELRRCTLRIIISAVFGALLSAPLFVPSIFAMFNAARANNSLANGLVVYPVEYYLSLPGQIIGNDAVPSFWVTGGISFLGIFAIVFGFRRFKTYLPFNLIWLASGIFLLSPIFAAIFNGGSSPSNRWLLLLSLPMALMIVQVVSRLADVTIKDLMWTAALGGIATISLWVTNDFDLTMNYGLLIATFFAGITVLLFTKLQPNKRTPIILVASTLVSLFVLMNRNHMLNSSPDTTTMIPTQTVKKLTSEQANYAVTTPENTRSLIDDSLNNIQGISPANNLPLIGNTTNINSYWSLQNASTASFMSKLQNQTSNPNDVTGTLDYRNVLANILGVTTLYQNQSDHFTPYSYEPQLNQLVNGQSIAVSKNAYPLMYLPKSVLSTKTFAKLSATQREAALADSIVVKGSKSKADSAFASKVIKTPISLNGTSNWQKNLTYEYTTHPSVLPDGIFLKANSALKGTELHLELTKIKYQPFTMQQRYQNALATYQFNYAQALQNPQKSTDLRYNPKAFSFNWLRKNITQIGPKINGYSLTSEYRGDENTVYQPGRNNLSFYQKRSEITLNLGTAGKTGKTHFIPITIDQPGKYRFKISAVAIPVDSRFDQVAQTAIQSAPKKIRYGKNTISAQINVPKAKVLATTIPASPGWTSTSNQLITINDGMLGIKLHAGNNVIHLKYQTPWLQIGLFIGLGGFVLLIILSLLSFIKRKIK